jgi:hypothetical protein
MAHAVGNALARASAYAALIGISVYFLGEFWRLLFLAYRTL